MIHMNPPLEEESSSYFADRLRELRQRVIGKQLCLSCAIGCTDAAVSFWESGKRLPQLESLSRILDALARGGASPTELSGLHHSWEKARAQCQPRPPLRADAMRAATNRGETATGR
jgi:transcriptional regulator with XRE-family HTH domain